MFEVDGQTAIVTGAANGIGEVISRRLANAGARVAIADIDERAAAAAAERIGEHSFPVRLDVTDANSVQQAIEMVLAHTQSLEIVVNKPDLPARLRQYGSKPMMTGTVCWPSTSRGPFSCVVP